MSRMNSSRNLFLATQLRILLPKIHRGIVNKQTPKKQDPSTLKTSSGPSDASQSFTKYVRPNVKKLRALIATKASSANLG